MAERYYWLKLKRDFFKRHDIRIIESMPNGKDYVLFYLKLLCESVDHEGNLRFSEEIPYNEEMLATITNTNVDIVRGAISVFAGLNMMEIMDDGTYFMNEVAKMTGSETEWAKKKRLYRQSQKSLPEGHDEDIVLPLSDKSKSKSKSKNNNIHHLDDEFEKIWAIYPRKQGKKRAREAFERAIKKGATINEITAGLEAYCDYIKREKVKGMYIKQGSTFFQQEAWLDDWSGKRQDKSDLDGII